MTFYRLILLATLAFSARTYAGPLDATSTSGRTGADRNCDPEALSTIVNTPAHIKPKYDIVDTRELLQIPWSPKNFSDPQKHNPRDYTYLICAADFGQTTPERLAQRVKTKSILSLSLVSNKRHATFEMAGAIVKAPSEALIAAKNQDVYVENYLQSVLTTSGVEEYSRKLTDTIGLPGPNKILKDTEKGEYNEVVADGTKGIEMTGLFMVVFDGKPLVPKATEAAIRKYAKEHNLPIIEIEYENAGF